jgi:hypothetical protein
MHHPDTELTRDDLGRLVRAVWLRWASSQPEATPEWLTSFEDLPEADQELGCLIGEGVASRFRDEIAELRGERDVLRAQVGHFTDLCRRACQELRAYWWTYPMTSERVERVRAAIRDCHQATCDTSEGDGL